MWIMILDFRIDLPISVRTTKATKKFVTIDGSGIYIYRLQGSFFARVKAGYFRLLNDRMLKKQGMSMYGSTVINHIPKSNVLDV